MCKIDIDFLEPYKDDIVWRKESHYDPYLEDMDIRELGIDLIENGTYYPFIATRDKNNQYNFIVTEGCHRLKALKFIKEINPDIELILPVYVVPWECSECNDAISDKKINANIVVHSDLLIDVKKEKLPKGYKRLEKNNKTLNKIRIRDNGVEIPVILIRGEFSIYEYYMVYTTIALWLKYPIYKYEKKYGKKYNKRFSVETGEKIC